MSDEPCAWCGEPRDAHPVRRFKASCDEWTDSSTGGKDET